jgi:hypothetical protein
MTVAAAANSDASTAYVWRAGSRRKTHVSAAVVGEEIAAVAAAHGGICSPGALVDRSRPNDAVLHGEFLWDDSAAGEEYRKYQARNLVRAVVVVRDATPAPAFVHVKIVDDQAQDDESAIQEGYMRVEVAMQLPDLRGQVLSETIGMLSGLRRRLVELQHVQSVVAAIDAALEAARVAREQEVSPPTK